MIAEITQGAKLTDKESCMKLKKKLDETPELSKPSISSSESKFLFFLYFFRSSGKWSMASYYWKAICSFCHF